MRPRCLGAPALTSYDFAAAVLRTLARKNVFPNLGGIVVAGHSAGFDGSCPAMAQGPNRFERGKAFHRYVTTKLGATHTFVAVPLCGHNARCMFTAERALPVPFPPAAGR